MNTTTVADSAGMEYVAERKEAVETLATTPDVTVFKRGALHRAVKRCFDAVFAMCLVLVMLPVLLLIALAIKLDSPGPVLFRQRRHGLHRRSFTVLKFRTMCTNASSELHRQYIAALASDADTGEGGLKKLTVDPRVTRVGRFLRKTSLDELPQLLNVIRGEMSIVGPRPAIEYELEFYSKEDYARFLVRPGLTGLWQVSGRSELGFREMLALDAQYARSASLKTDAMILARTPIALVRGRAA